jgi:hypothetical protein
MSRTHGKRGAILSDVSKLRGPIFEDYITDKESLPDVPVDVDHITGVKAFYMYANGPDPTAAPEIAQDGIGDCTFAALAEFYNVASAYSGTYPGGVHFPTMNVVTGYSSCSGYVLGQENTDNGCELPSVAAWATKTALVDDQSRSHQLAGWGQIKDPSNPWTLRRAINLFGAVYMGFTMPDDAMNEFDDEQPFTDISAAPDPNEGHCMLYASSKLATYQESPLDPTGQLITWGSVQDVSPVWNTKYSFQALVLVTQDYVDKNGTTVQGLSLQQMLSDSQDVSSSMLLTRRIQKLLGSIRITKTAR